MTLKILSTSYYNALRIEGLIPPTPPLTLSVCLCLSVCLSVCRSWQCLVRLRFTNEKP